MPTRLDRRLFLRGLGGAALALPLLPSLLPRELRAAPGDLPKRFIAIKSYSTQNILDWYPTRTPNGYQLRDALYNGSKADGTTYLHGRVNGTSYGRADIRDFDQGEGISSILNGDVRDYLGSYNLLRGVDFLPDTNHNDGGMLGNYAAADNQDTRRRLDAVPTIDQVLAYSQAFYAQAPAVRSLHLSPGSQNSISFTDFGNRGGPVEQVQAHVDPLTAFNEAFGNYTPPDETPRVDPNIKLVDRVIEDYRATANHPRLSATDRDTLERHIGFLSELENNLKANQQQGGGARCMVPPRPRSYPNDPPFGNLGDVMGIRQSYELMLDVMAAAIMCDRTRVITVDVRKALSDGRGNEQGYWHGADQPGSWHGDAHSWGDPVADRNLLQLNRWIAADIFVGVLRRLDVVEEGETSFLDNSLVYWGNELGFNHLNYSVPAILAGTAGGALRTGQYIDYIDWDGRAYFSQHNGNVIRGIPHNRLLVTIMQAMGLRPSDYERNGQPGYGSYETLGKSANTHAVDYDSSKFGDPLPGLLV